MITIIIPTYNEKKNIEKLVRELLKIRNTKILIVDDNSPDGTGLVAENLKKRFKNIDVLHRTKKLGLGSAILEGVNHAKTDVVGVMDADFSHPPALLKKMTDEIKNSDMVIASRYVRGGGTDESWSTLRKIISKSAILLVRPIVRIKDPMSGFFLVKKDVIRDISPESCKICLEILVKSKIKNFREIPYTFINREHGKSKIMTPKEILRYVKHVINLYIYKLK